jgi:phosphopentomutase
MKFKRVFLIVVDSLGIGAAKDAALFDDVGSDTFGHIAEKMETFTIPNFVSLGVANLKKLDRVEPAADPLGYYLKLEEASNGKDTMTGHWEMMGLYTEKPFIAFTDTGFPQELMDELERNLSRVLDRKYKNAWVDIDNEPDENGNCVIRLQMDIVYEDILGDYTDALKRLGEDY